MIGKCIKHKSIYYLWSEGLVRSSLRVAGQRDLMLTLLQPALGVPSPQLPRQAGPSRGQAWEKSPCEVYQDLWKELKHCSQEAVVSLFFCIIIIGQLYSHFYLLGDKTLEGKMGGTCLCTNFNRPLLSNLSHSHQLIHPPSSLRGYLYCRDGEAGAGRSGQDAKVSQAIIFPTYTSGDHGITAQQPP